MSELIQLPPYENVADLLDLDPATLPSPLFTLVDGTGQISTHTMQDLREGARRWAATLAQRIQPGDNVILCMPTSMDFLTAFLGVQLAGAVAVPTPYAFHRQAEYLEEYLRTRAAVIDDCGAVALLTQDNQRQIGNELASRCATLEHVITIEDCATDTSAYQPTKTGRDGLALLQYTSGSTGNPKGVRITHECLLWNLEAIGQGMEAVPGDRVVSWLPLYHDMGLIGGWLWPLANGCEHVVMATEVFLANPWFYLQAMTQVKATITVAPNFGYALCVKRVKDEQMGALDLSHLRVALCGAEPIDATVMAAFHDRFAKAGLRKNVIIPVYGLAEATLAVTFAKPETAIKTMVLDRQKLEVERTAVEVPAGTPGAATVVCVGRALLDSEVRIADDGGATLPDRREGQIMVRSGSLMKGYHQNEEASAAVLRDGWLATGDLGYLDGGELYVTGRTKDLIITYGRNFYPHDIEWLAASVSGVRTGCVSAFGVPNEDASTEEIVVIAETKEGDKEQLQAIRREIRKLLISAIECNPKHIILVGPGGVPKTTSGKIKRVEARAMFLAGTLDRRL
jgi:acyl-CoA synthetase (AMP-forming)/AMP-acid ligase II